MKTILVIDDDEDIRLALEILLEGKGYQLEFAANGMAALERLDIGPMPDLILLDMAMPVMDGWQFSEKFRARYPQRSPVVVMTAAADAKKRAEEIQADGFLSKPYSLGSLLETLQTYLG